MVCSHNRHIELYVCSMIFNHAKYIPLQSTRSKIFYYDIIVGLRLVFLGKPPSPSRYGYEYLWYKFKISTSLRLALGRPPPPTSLRESRLYIYGARYEIISSIIKIHKIVGSWGRKSSRGPNLGRFVGITQSYVELLLKLCQFAECHRTILYTIQTHHFSSLYQRSISVHGWR